MQHVALTIAGSDPSGGAGLQADLKVFHQFGVYGESVATLITVQNSVSVSEVEVLSPDIVTKQVQAVISDIPPQAAKTGALGNKHIVNAIAALATEFSFPLVVDPVMISKHGSLLLCPESIDALRTKLLPCAYLVTPNIPEAEALSGVSITSLEHIKEAAKRISDFGPKNVLIKGGHFNTDPTDVFFSDNTFSLFPGKRIETPHTHGTGCALSAAITAQLAQGKELDTTIQTAKEFIQHAIETNPGLGKGCGPINFFSPYGT